jgi:hypothetical protein
MSHCYRQADLAVKEASNAGLQSYILGYQGLVAQGTAPPGGSAGVFRPGTADRPTIHL